MTTARFVSFGKMNRCTPLGKGTIGQATERGTIGHVTGRGTTGHPIGWGVSVLMYVYASGYS